MIDELSNKDSHKLINTLACSPNTPLWQRAPTKDEDGMCLEIPAAIKVAVPEALLVADNRSKGGERA
ncbi:MAG: hypothetical protein KAG34_02875 [Cocleimonas sp.]|nr:hypothetical protein [Cocleimonas sp.]